MTPLSSTVGIAFPINYAAEPVASEKAAEMAQKKSGVEPPHSKRPAGAMALKVER